MSSPQRRPSSSSMRSTPSRQLNGAAHTNGYPATPPRYNSPSFNGPTTRHILEEFSRMVINDDRLFNKSLDEQSASQQQRHLDALDRALAKHAEVRQSAERARELVELELEEERVRIAAEQAKAVEMARRAVELQRLAEMQAKVEEDRHKEEERRKAEALQRERDEAKQKADHARKQEEEERARRKAADEKAVADQKAADERKVEADRKAKADADALRQQQNQPAQQPSHVQSSSARVNGVAAPSQAATASKNGVQLPPGIPQELVTSPEQLAAVHNQYLDLHKRLKKMRQEVTDQYKQIGALKNQVSDWRRAIKKCVGQMGKGQTKETKDGNRKSIAEVTSILDQASQISDPTINITDFLINPQQPPGGQANGPAILLLLLNYFSKYIISQMTHESGVDGKTADPLGVMAVTIFARPAYLFNGTSLIDIFWAKYHKACPPLFGISGSESTPQGRMRLGWAYDRDERSFIDNKEHFDRMSGLGAGFAAMTLRDFSKSKNANPAPNRLFWQAASRILNTPPEVVGATHCVLLKAMIQNFVPRIIATFGDAGLALMRTACRSFPEAKGPRNAKGNKLPAVTALESLPGALMQEIGLSL